MLLDRSLPEKPRNALILGAGKFGSSAAVKIAERWPDCSIRISDIKTRIDDSLPGEHFPATEAMDLMNDYLKKGITDDIVVPCIPVHAAFNWVLSHLGFCIPVPVQLMEELPGAIAGKDGCIYSSLSNFTCPEDCTEPGDRCPVTNRKREAPLFEIISSLSVHSYTIIALRSAQLLPGTGAFTSGVLFELLDLVRKKRGRFLIATASKCHGVIHGFTH